MKYNLCVPNDKKNIWLLSAYSSDSHATWVDWLVSNHPQFDWDLLELPGRYFRWRIRGNPLSWLSKLPSKKPDLIIATSMVDIATIKGINPRLAAVPVYYYFHENQFAYPCSEDQFPSIDPQMVQLYGALSAQRLLFNSSYNQRSFLDGVDALLAVMPDEVPDDIRHRLLPKCEVLPVPVTPLVSGEKDSQLILWNHRWEYDKDPALFSDAMLSLAETGVTFRLALLGARYDRSSEPLDRLRDRLGASIIADGRVEREEYKRLLSKASIVVSTSLHEFQGLSMLEAASAGVVPLVPDALCYPEQYDAEYRYPAGDKEALVSRLKRWLTVELPPAVDVSSWTSAVLSERWLEVISSNLDERKS